MTLQDNFDDGVTAPWWCVYTSTGASVAETSQRLEVTTTATGIIDNAGYCTQSSYDLAKHFAQIQVVELDSLNTMSLAICAQKGCPLPPGTVFGSLPNWYRIWKNRLTSRCEVHRRIGNGSVETLYEGAWNAATGTLKIEVKNNVISFYEDGVLRWSEAYALPSTVVYLYIFGTGDGGANVGTDAFDNFLTDIPTTPSPPEGEPDQPRDEPPPLPPAQPEPAPGPTGYIDVIQNRAKWASVFILDEGSLKPISRTYPLWIQTAPATSLGSGQKDVTTAGTAVQLSSTSVPIISVVIKAKGTNTGNIYVGGSGVSSTTGYILDANEFIALDIDDLSDIWIDADTDGEGVSYIYLVT